MTYVMLTTFIFCESTKCERKNKKLKNTVESRDNRQMFLSRSTERQAGNDGKTVVID